MLDQLVDVGQQLALAFNKEGSVLAAGGEVQTVPSPFLFGFKYICYTLCITICYSFILSIVFRHDINFGCKIFFLQK